RLLPASPRWRARYEFGRTAGGGKVTTRRSTRVPLSFKLNTMTARSILLGMGALLVCAGLFKIYHARQASPAQPAAMPVAAATPASPASPPLMLAELWAADIPRKAPELAVQLTGGGQILLSQFRGKVVMIDFVHTTCPHCQNASTIVERLYKEYGPRGFQPLGVAFNDNAALLVPDFV